MQQRLQSTTNGGALVNHSSSSPLAARARNASRLTGGLIAMAEGQLEAGGQQPAWMVMRDCLANALTYDDAGVHR